jgi:hypothetical protein
MRALADRIGRELGEMKDYLGGPYSWQRFPDPRVTYYFAPGRFISHADYAARVFIPLRRVGQGSDLFLHETAHVLVTLRTITAWELPDSLPDKRDRVARTERRWPLWLDEGFASYASQDVAAMHGYAPDDIMGAGGNAHVDAACARWLRTDDGRAVLRWIGAPGMPPRVETDREHVAKPFYVCAQSFCKFLASRIGRRALTQANGAMDGDPNVEIARTAGVDMKSLRAEWLALIGASATSSTRP